MAEVLEPSVAIGRCSKRASGATGAAAETAFHDELSTRSRRRSSPATWSSTLEPQDLARLMAVIETELLPTLLRSYRPAQRKPLNGSGLA